MKCKNCGAEFDEGIFCPECGVKYEANDNILSQEGRFEKEEIGLMAEGMGSESLADQNHNQNVNEWENGVPNTNSAGENVRMRYSGMSILAMVLGIVGMILSCIYIGIIFGILAFILSIVSLTKKDTKKGMAIIGLITSAFSIIIFSFIALADIDIVNTTGGIQRQNQMESNNEVINITSDNIVEETTKNIDKSNNLSFVDYEEIYGELTEKYNEEITDYAFYDIDKDGYLEFILRYGTCTADMMYIIYSTDGINLIEMGEIVGGDIELYECIDQKGLYTDYCKMGYEIVSYVNIENGNIIEEVLYEGETDSYGTIDGIEIEELQMPIEMYNLNDGVNWEQEGLAEDIMSIESQERDLNEYGTMTSIEDMPIYSQYYLVSYVEMNNIEIPAPPVKSIIEEALSNDIAPLFVKEENEGEYVVTNEQTDLMYYGEVDRNKPHGVGKLVKIISAYEYEYDGKVRLEFNDYLQAEDESQIYGVLVYVGEFKKGYYDGYGWEYITPYTNWSDLANSGYSRNLGQEYDRIGSNIQENILGTCNPIGYMGEFKEGLYHGEGVRVMYAIREMPEEMDESQIVEFFGYRIDRELGINVGEFEKGRENGEIQEYLRGMLAYSGEEKDAEYHGKGTSYYIGTNQKKYEGEWRNGYYDGKGTLYDEDGSVIYEGKWDMGDYAH